MIDVSRSENPEIQYVNEDFKSCVAVDYNRKKLN